MRRRRAGAALAAAALAVALLAAAPTTAAPAPVAPAAPVAADQLRECARPALSPALRLDPAKVPGLAAPRTLQREGRLALEVAQQGRDLGVPARAQALAVSAALRGDVEAGRSATRFYRALDGVEGWQALPPTIAVHRALGTADPFAYEGTWNRAVTLLATLVARPGAVASLVSAAGRAPSRCYVVPTDKAALPLPPGTSYTVAPAGGARPARRDLEAPVELQAPCGTPVVAATAGTVEVLSDEQAGPWLVRVRQPGTGVVTSYAHLQAPQVRDGATVLVGQPLAEVGDLGETDGCSLGLTMTQRKDGETTPLDPVAYLLDRGANEGEQPTVVPATSFRVASYNVLGHHLTAPGGGKRGFGPGTTRVANGIARMEAQGVSIVVLNEFESPQAGVFLADGGWGVHRATPNNVFRDGNSNGNAVAWRSDTWELAGTDEFTVPWSTTLHMPVVTLRHLETGATVQVIGVHNPASTSRQGNQSGARTMARDVELAFMSQLLEERPGVPIIFAGDMNERSEAFCGFTGPGFLASSAGGSVGSPCSVPSHGPVDWIFGTLDLDFTGQTIDKSFLGSISDHPLLIGDVLFPEHELPEVLVERGDPAA